MGNRINFAALAEQFDHSHVAAVVLMGSYARGTPGPYSDIDLVRFTIEDEHGITPGGSYLIDDRLVVVSNAAPAQVEDMFARPEVAVQTILGLRSGRALIDRDGFFHSLQDRAKAFKWDQEMQAKADHWASKQMVGWSEEARKGLEGLRSSDNGRLLHGRFGCSWGLARVLCVQKGIFLTGDNTLFEQVIAHVGPDSRWAHLCRSVCGSASLPSTLIEEVRAGLQLYNQTAEMLDDILLGEDRAVVANTVALINQALATRNE